jgi:hypothetical protein
MMIGVHSLTIPIPGHMVFAELALHLQRQADISPKPTLRLSHDLSLTK